MNGLWPKNNRGARERLGRVGAALSARALSGALLVCSVGCAHTTPASQLAQVPLAPSAEEARLERLLVQREQTIQQLEGRMAMLEASERQLRDQLANARADEQARETVRIGARKAEREPVHEPRETRVTTPSSEPRPMLRLQGDKLSEPRGERQAPRGEPTSSWSAPVTSERLTVATVPRLSTLVDRPAAPPASAPVVLARETSAPADELYVHALDLLRRREFPEALRELDAFLRGFPADGRVARAHFWRGEILFAERDFARALAAYEQALVEDPRGDKAADTLLRIARCQHRLGAHERARAALLKLRTQFPDSEAAHVASQLTQEDT